MSSAAPLQALAAKPLQAASPSPILQRKCACGGRASALTGECEECREKKIEGVQTKLQISEPGDVYEQEADRVADQVLRMPAPAVAATPTPPQISRKCAECEAEEGLQETSAGLQTTAGEAPAVVHEVLRSPGQPLDAASRGYFDPRFGHDFSKVRVHTDEKAARSARSIHALAYTVGDDIVIGEGKFAPAPEGRRLLAHELTHVVQQRGAARTVQRAPIVAPAAGAAKPTGTKPGGPKAISSSFNSYVDLFNGFQDLAAAAINRGGAGLDSARFGNDLSASHRSLLSRVRTVLIQAQEQDKEQRLAAAAAWPGLAAKLLAAITEASRLQFPGQVLAAITDDIAMLGRKYVHARAGGAEPELESFEDYTDTVHGMSELLWVFGRMGEAGEGVIREEVPNRKETIVSSAVLELNAKQRAALAGVQFGSRLNARHAKILNTLRTALLLARSEAPGSAYKALILWRSIHGDLQHVLARAPIYQVQFDVSAVRGEVDSTAQVLANHYAAVHQENVGVALTKPRAPDQVKAERAIAKAAGPVVAAGMKEARAVEDFQYALTIIEQHLTPSTDRPGEWILTSGDTVIRVRADQVQSLHATVAKELKTYMAQLVKAMVRVWQTYDSIQRGNSTFKLAVLGGWGGATDPGDQTHFKDSLISVRDKTVYPLVDNGKYVEAFKWIMTQKIVVDRQANEVGDYDSDLDLGYSRLATAANVVQVALVSLVPVAGEAALASGAGVWAVAGTAIAAGGGGAGSAETLRQLASGEDLDPSKIGKATYSGALVGASAVAPAATKGLGKLIALGEEGTTAVGAHALAAGTVGAIQSKLGGGDALQGFAGGFLGSMAGSATSQALGPIAKNPVANTVIAGGIGAGTAAVTGADPLAGAVGGISGALVSPTSSQTAGSQTTRRTDVAGARVGGEMTHPTRAAGVEPTTPAFREPAERLHTPAPAGSQTVPLRSTYAPRGEEAVGAVRPNVRARPFYANDPQARPEVQAQQAAKVAVKPRVAAHEDDAVRSLAGRDAKFAAIEKQRKAREASPPPSREPKRAPAAKKPAEAQPRVEEPEALPASGAREAAAKRSARDEVIQATQEKIAEIERQQGKAWKEISRLRKNIDERNAEIERLDTEIKNSRGEDQARAIAKRQKIEYELNEEQGGGVKAELKGTLEELDQFAVKKRNLLQALKLERPSLREPTKRAIEANSPREDRPPYRFLDREGKPIDGPVHYGHIWGKEHRRLALEAQEKGMNQSQFNDWVNNHPEWFRVESEAENLSHAFEKPGLD